MSATYETYCTVSVGVAKTCTKQVLYTMSSNMLSFGYGSTILKQIW